MELSNNNVKMLLNKLVRLEDTDARKAAFYAAPLVRAMRVGTLTASQYKVVSEICGDTIELFIALGLITARNIVVYCDAIMASNMLTLPRGIKTRLHEEELFLSRGLVL